jgi:hypothetical protein
VGWGESVTLSLDILKSGRRLVAQGWTSGADARNRDNRPVHPWSSEARAWSVLGAIICGDETHQGRVPISQLAQAAVLLAHAVETESLTKWNDAPGRTQADAVAAFDAAIASAAERRESQVSRSNS